ncbi:MAG: hypothetical protein WCL44_02740 [bacterium]
MKILKRSADRAGHPSSEMRMKSPENAAAAPASKPAAHASAQGATQVQDGNPIKIVHAKTTIGQYVLASAGGVVAGLVLGFLVFKVFHATW